MSLLKGADTVELKLTVPETDQRSAVQGLGMDPLDAQIRQVFFFDTPDLIARQARSGRPGASRAEEGRRLGGQAPADRPGRHPGRGSRLAQLRDRGRRDARRVRLLRLDEARAAPSRRQGGRRRPLPLRKLFSKEQRAFFAEHAPDGVELDDLAVLGPIFVLKLTIHAQGLRPPPRGRDVALPRQLAHPRAVDEVHADGGVRHRRRSQGIPRRQRHRPLGRASGEDEEGTALLLEGSQAHVAVGPRLGSGGGGSTLA